MPVYLLITGDDYLRAEIEGCLGAFSGHPTLIQVGSAEEVRECMDSFSDVEAVLCDSRFPSPPADLPLPVLMIGEKNGTLFPAVPRPVYPDTLSEALHHLDSGTEAAASGSADPTGSEVTFMRAFIREVVHDLNNQFTTLRGNIPFLMEAYPDDDGTLKDLHTATERGASLLHLLEGLKEDAMPEPADFPYALLHKELMHFGKKMIPQLQPTPLPADLAGMSLRGDALLICAHMLRALSLTAPFATEIRLEFHPTDQTLRIVVDASLKASGGEALEKSLQSLLSLVTPGRLKCTLYRNRLSFELPRS